MVRQNFASVVAVLLLAAAADAGTTYIERFDTQPGGTGLAAMLGSPNGLSYDWYQGRASRRPIGTLGSGDEAFYWIDDSIFETYVQPWTTYPDYSAHTRSDPLNGSLLNGYGTGFPGGPGFNDFVLGITFAAGPTQFVSADFASALGSNAGTGYVQLIGLARDDSGTIIREIGGVEVRFRQAWTADSYLPQDLTQSRTITGGSEAIDRLEVRRGPGYDLGSIVPAAWYTMDNLTYKIPGDPNGGYLWRHYTPQDWGVGGVVVPLPSSISMGLVGLVGVITAPILRRRTACS